MSENSTNNNPKQRVKVENLPAEETKLTEEEMKKVQGGIAQGGLNIAGHEISHGTFDIAGHEITHGGKK